MLSRLPQSVRREWNRLSRVKITSSGTFGLNMHSGYSIGALRFHRDLSLLAIKRAKGFTASKASVKALRRARYRAVCTTSSMPLSISLVTSCYHKHQACIQLFPYIYLTQACSKLRVAARVLQSIYSSLGAGFTARSILKGSASNAQLSILLSP